MTGGRIDPEVFERVTAFAGARYLKFFPVAAGTGGR